MLVCCLVSKVPVHLLYDFLRFVEHIAVWWSNIAVILLLPATLPNIMLCACLGCVSCCICTLCFASANSFFFVFILAFFARFSFCCWCLQSSLQADHSYASSVTGASGNACCESALRLLIDLARKPRISSCQPKVPAPFNSLYLCRTLQRQHLNNNYTELQFTARMYIPWQSRKNRSYELCNKPPR